MALVKNNDHHLDFFLKHKDVCNGPSTFTLICAEHQPPGHQEWEVYTESDQYSG